MKNNHPKYYVHGCSCFFDDMMFVIDSAESAEWNGESPYDWLSKTMGINVIDQNISWTEAIRFYFRVSVKVYTRDTKESNNLPF